MAEPQASDGVPDVSPTESPDEARKVDVSPIELFFDLVYVFAIAQLSHHLLTHLSLRGGLETAVLTVAVFTVWLHTTFEVTFFRVTRRSVQAKVLVAMGLGLFMNAGIADAFGDGGLGFAVPLVVIQLARGVQTTVSAPSLELRRHYRHMLVWLLASAPLWFIGALADHEHRLWWWLAASLVDLVGTLTAHRLPGRPDLAAQVGFDSEHMGERLTLFLIVALGEVVLTTGGALAEAPLSLTTVAVGTATFVVIAALWGLYFGGAAHIHADFAQRPPRAVDRHRRMMANEHYPLLGALVAIAVGCELVIAHPLDHGTWTVGLLLFGGALVYVLTQAEWIFRTTRRMSGSHAVVSCLLVGGIPTAALLPGLVSACLLASVLAGLLLFVVRWRPASSAR